MVKGLPSLTSEVVLCHPARFESRATKSYDTIDYRYMKLYMYIYISNYYIYIDTCIYICKTCIHIYIYIYE